MRPRFWRRRDRVPVSELRRTNSLRFGSGLLILLAIGVYFGFAQHIPFTHGYRLKAVFASAQNIAPRSPVRIAGVTVGDVVSVQREGEAGLVTMEIQQSGLPIHRDATLKIWPRLFLEGNWFVELRPGTPSSPTISSGSTIPITQTADPVQLDQVLDILHKGTRADLQVLLQEYGQALSSRPTSAENAEQAPEVRGKTGAEALKEAARHGPAALRGGAIVQQSLGGVEQHDISKLISGIERFTKGLSANEAALGAFVDHFDTFLESFANQSSSLRAAVAQLPGALRSTRGAFAALDGALAPIESFSKAITPGVSETGATIDAALPWIKQLDALLTPHELGGLAESLSEASPALAGLIGGQKAFFKQSNLFSRCLTKVFFPAGDVKLQDGAATTGSEAYREFWYLMTGLAGIGQNFDGNGAFSRFLAGGGGHTLVSGPTSIVGVTSRPGSKLIARATLSPEGTSPRFPATEPPYEPMVACDTQAVPDLNGPLSHGPADGSGG